MIKRYLAILFVGVMFIMLLSSCSTESPPLWPWWTKADSTAVEQELALWRDTLNGFHSIVGQNNTVLQYPIDLLNPLVKTDTMSTNGDSVVKIAHIKGFSNVIVDGLHLDELLFGVKNDTLLPHDTFCYVTYQDSTRNCIGVLRYDSLWTIKFYPVTTVDTTVTPPETIITYHVASITKTGFATTREEQDTIQHFTIMRKLELKKDSTTTAYHLKSLTGFGTYIPNTTDAPIISYVILTKPNGLVDTIRYSPLTDGRGIYNLKHKDSLYSVAINEAIGVRVVTSTPSDTLTDRNYFFLSCGIPYVASKYNITTSAKMGSGQAIFAQAGLGQIYIEVIPASTLFYPYRQWKSSAWAIPIRVK